MTPRLLDLYGRWVFDGPRTAQEQALAVSGATTMIHHRYNGRLLGVYVDNETPNRDSVARRMRQRVPMVIAGLYPSEDRHRIAGCIAALEWYPYHQGWNTGPPNGIQAIICQWAFAWPGDRPPTLRERMALLRDAMRLKPRPLILRY